MADKKKPTFRINVTNPTAEALSAPVKEQKTTDNKGVTTTQKTPQKTSQSTKPKTEKDILAEGNGPRSPFYIDAKKRNQPNWQEAVTKPKFTMPQKILSEGNGPVNPDTKKTSVANKTPLFKMWQDGVRDSRNPYEEIENEKRAREYRKGFSGKIMNSFETAEDDIKKKKDKDAEHQEAKKRKNLQDFYKYDDLIDTEAHDITEEDVLKFRQGPLAVKDWLGQYKYSNWNNEEDVKAVAEGMEKFLKDYEAEYGHAYDKYDYDKHDNKWGKVWRAPDYFDEKQRNNFFYVYNEFGEDAAKDYATEVIFKDEGYRSRAQTGGDAREAYFHAKEETAEAYIKKFYVHFLDWGTQYFGSEEEQKYFSTVLNAIETGTVNGRDTETGKFLAQMGNLAVRVFAENSLVGVFGAPFKAISAIKGIGNVAKHSKTIGNAIAGFVTGYADVRSEQTLLGVRDVDGALGSAIAGGIKDSVLFPLLGKGAGKLKGAFAGKVTESALKKIILDTSIDTLSSMGIGTAGGVADILINEAFMGDNSRYDVIYQNYINSGINEKTATKKAIQDAYVNPIVNGAIMFGLMGGGRAFLGNAKTAIDFTVRGKNIKNGLISSYRNKLKETYGDRLSNDAIDGIAENLFSDKYIARTVIDTAKMYGNDTFAAKNAELLDARIKNGKKITASELGAQDMLNGMAAYEFYRYTNAIDGLTKIQTKLDPTLSDDLEGEYLDGEVRLSTNPEDSLLDTVKHEYVHAIENRAKDAWNKYVSILESNETFEVVQNEIRRRYREQGKTVSDTTVRSEAAAEVGRLLLPKSVEGIARLSRRAEGKETIYDNAYEGIRYLRMKLKSARKKTFYDADTGFRATYDELYKMEKILEGALELAGKNKSADLTRIMHKHKNNDKIITVNMDDDLRAEMIANKQIEIVHYNREVSLKLGSVDIERLQTMFSKWMTPIINKIAEEFGITGREYYNSDISIVFQFSKSSLGESVNKQRRNYGDFIKMLSVLPDVVKNAVGIEVHADRYKGTYRQDDNLKHSYVLLSAFNNGEGIIPVKLEVKEFLDRPNKLYVAISVTRKEAEIIGGRPTDEQLPYSPYPASKITISDLVKIVNPIEGGTLKYLPDKILDDEQIISKRTALIRDAEKYAELLAKTENGNKIKSGDGTTSQARIKRNYDRETQFASKKTPEAIRERDLEKYGYDIEQTFRSLDVPNLRERDVAELSQRIRDLTDSVYENGVGVLSEEGIEGYVNQWGKYLYDRDYSGEDTMTLLKQAAQTAFEVLDAGYEKRQREAHTALAKAIGHDYNPKADDISTLKNDTSRTEEEAPEIAELRNTGNEIREDREKLSRTFTNTMHKEYFADFGKTVEGRERDFVYEAVGNKELAGSAIDEVAEKGADAVLLELAGKTEGVTPYDTALAWAVALHYRTTGQSEKLMDLMGVMRPKWTEAAQSIQAIRLFDMMTLEGKLLHAQKTADRLVDAQMKKRSNYKQLKIEEKEAKRADLESIKRQREAGVREDEIKRRTNLEAFYAKRNLDYVPEETLKYISDNLKLLDSLNDEDDPQTIINIMLGTNKKRRLAFDWQRQKGTRKLLTEMYEKAGNEKGYEFLKESAAAQLFAMLDDVKDQKPWLEKLFTVQTGSMLSRGSTILRNIVSNLGFNQMEGFVANTGGWLADVVISLVNGQRSIKWGERPSLKFEGIRAGVNRAKSASLEQLLKIDTIIGGRNGYENTSKKTFNHPLTSKIEKYLGFTLTVPDEFQKGVIENRLQRVYGKWIEEGVMTADDLAEIIGQEIRYRTFQDDTLLGTFLEGFKSALNFGRSVGIGDFVVKFTKVPGAVLTRTLEYSPLGYLKAITQNISLYHNAKIEGRTLSIPEQRKIAMSYGRATTALGLQLVGMALFHKGFLVGSDTEEVNEEDEEYKKTYLDQALNIKGYKLNLSAVLREIDYWDEAMKENSNKLIGIWDIINHTNEMNTGDTFVDISWTNFGPQLVAGANAYNQINEKGFGEYVLSGTPIVDSFNYGLKRIETLPAFTGVKNIANNWQYKDGYFDFLVTSAADSMLTFLPNSVKGIADALDPYERDLYHTDSSTLTGALNAGAQRFLNALPLSSRIKDKYIPRKVDIFGRDAKDTLGNVWSDLLNDTVLPGRIGQYKSDNLTDELEALYEYNPDVLPGKPYTKYTVVIDGKTTNFSLYGEDYETYSRMLGTAYTTNVEAFRSSEYYQLLPMHQRADAIAQIKRDTEKTIQEAWVMKIHDAENIDITNHILTDVGAYREQASTMVIINEAVKNLETADDVQNVIIEKETVPLTEKEAKDKIAEIKENITSKQSRIARLKKGGKNAYSEEYREDGTEYRLYAKDMTPERLEAEIQECENWIDYYNGQIEDISQGNGTKEVTIKGKWDDLTSEQQDILIKKVENNPEYILIDRDTLLKNAKAQPDTVPKEEVIYDLDKGDRIDISSLLPKKDENTPVIDPDTIVAGTSGSGRSRSGGGRRSSGGSYTLSADRQLIFVGPLGNITLFDVYKAVRAKWTSRITPPKFTMPKIRAQKPKFVMPKIKA